jgi:hypothetical protein
VIPWGLADRLTPQTGDIDKLGAWRNGSRGLQAASCRGMPGHIIDPVGRDEVGEVIMRFLKRVLIALLLLLGVLLVYEGFGFDFRILNFESLDPYAIQIGIAIIVFGVLIARFWTIPE